MLSLSHPPLVRSTLIVERWKRQPHRTIFFDNRSHRDALSSNQLCLSVAASRGHPSGDGSREAICCGLKLEGSLAEFYLPCSVTLRLLSAQGTEQRTISWVFSPVSTEVFFPIIGDVTDKQLEELLGNRKQFTFTADVTWRFTSKEIMVAPFPVGKTSLILGRCLGALAATGLKASRRARLDLEVASDLVQAPGLLALPSRVLPLTDGFQEIIPNMLYVGADPTNSLPVLSNENDIVDALQSGNACFVCEEGERVLPAVLTRMFDIPLAEATSYINQRWTPTTRSHPNPADPDIDFSHLADAVLHGQPTFLPATSIPSACSPFHSVLQYAFPPASNKYLRWQDVAAHPDGIAHLLPLSGDACWLILQNTLHDDAVVTLSCTDTEWRLWAIVCEFEAICDSLLLGIDDENNGNKSWAHVSAVLPHCVSIYKEEHAPTTPWLVTKDLKVRALLYCRRAPPLCSIPYDDSKSNTENINKKRRTAGICTESSLRLLDGAGLHAQPNVAAIIDENCKTVEDVHRLCAAQLKIPHSTQRLYALGPDRIERLTPHTKLPVPARPLILTAAASPEEPSDASELLVLFKEFRNGALLWLGIAHIRDGQCIQDLQHWLAQRTTGHLSDTSSKASASSNVITWAYKERRDPSGCDVVDLARPLHSFCSQGDCIVVYNKDLPQYCSQLTAKAPGKLRDVVIPLQIPLPPYVYAIYERSFPPILVCVGLTYSPKTAARRSKSDREKDGSEELLKAVAEQLGLQTVIESEKQSPTRTCALLMGERPSTLAQTLNGNNEEFTERLASALNRKQGHWRCTLVLCIVVATNRPWTVLRARAHEKDTAATSHTAGHEDKEKKPDNGHDVGGILLENVVGPECWKHLRGYARCYGPIRDIVSPQLAQQRKRAERLQRAQQEREQRALFQQQEQKQQRMTLQGLDEEEDEVDSGESPSDAVGKEHHEADAGIDNSDDCRNASGSKCPLSPMLSLGEKMVNHAFKHTLDTSASITSKPTPVTSVPAHADHARDSSAPSVPLPPHIVDRGKDMHRASLHRPPPLPPSPPPQYCTDFANLSICYEGRRCPFAHPDAMLCLVEAPKCPYAGVREKCPLQSWCVFAHNEAEVHCPPLVRVRNHHNSTQCFVEQLLPPAIEYVRFLQHQARAIHMDLPPIAPLIESGRSGHATPSCFTPQRGHHSYSTGGHTTPDNRAVRGSLAERSGDNAEPRPEASDDAEANDPKTLEAEEEDDFDLWGLGDMFASPYAAPHLRLNFPGSRYDTLSGVYPDPISSRFGSIGPHAVPVMHSGRYLRQQWHTSPFSLSHTPHIMMSPARSPSFSGQASPVSSGVASPHRRASGYSSPTDGVYRGSWTNNAYLHVSAPGALMRRLLSLRENRDN